MKTLLLILSLMTAPALAQTPAPKAAPKSTSARAADPCAPIGRTARGELVYSMKCDTLPGPPPPPAQAEAREAPAPAAAAPEPEVQRSGIFGWSYDRRQ